VIEIGLKRFKGVFTSRIVGRYSFKGSLPDFSSCCPGKRCDRQTQFTDQDRVSSGGIRSVVRTATGCGGCIRSENFFVRDDLNMTRRSIRLLLPLLSLAALSISGCKHGRHREHLVNAQTHARDLYAENQRLQAADAQNTMMIQGLDSERQSLMSQLGDTQSHLATANDRINNLMAERSDLTNRFAQAMTGSTSDGSGLNSALAAEGFEYDPATGLSKYRSDILFDLGSDAIRAEAAPIIREFASAVKSGSAGGFRILIVGHTDDQNIVRAETAIKHPTNWHLSTDRSDAVILELLKQGVEPTRIASMGYSEFQPLESSQSDTARQRNRRVELFVVPNDPSLAKWDPATAIR